MIQSKYLSEVLDCNHNTPKHFSHQYGQFKPFFIKNKLFCFINIPKCASQDTEHAIAEHPEVKLFDTQAEVSTLERIIFHTGTTPSAINGRDQFFTPKHIQQATWFCNTRDINQRLASGYDPSWLNFAQRTNRQILPLHELLKVPTEWDEHIQPQESFLQIFNDSHIQYTKLKIDSTNPQQLSNSLSNFLDIDIKVGK